MSTELEHHTGGSALAISETQTGWTAQQLAGLQHLGVEEATRGDLELFFYQCQRTGLDPFARQIYMIGRQSSENVNGQWVKSTKYTIQTGIDGFRLVGRRAADTAGHTLEISDTQWADPNGNWHDVWVWDTPPAAARVAIIRHGGRFPAIALWAEYVQTKRDGTPTKMWQDRGAGQLAKCAEALAWRKAFPQDLSGLYTADEMGKANDQEPMAPHATHPAGPAADDTVHVAEVVDDIAEGRKALLARLLDVIDEAAVPAIMTEWAADNTTPINQTDNLVALEEFVAAKESAAKPATADNAKPTKATQAQLNKMRAMMGKVDLTERAAVLDFCTQEAGRTIGSTKELTKTDAAKVIESLQQLVDLAAEKAAPPLDAMSAAYANMKEGTK